MRITQVLTRPSCSSSPPSCSDLVALSEVFVVRYFRVVCLYYWRSPITLLVIYMSTVPE